jgi:uncharacterized protein (TIGR00369 family)
MMDPLDADRASRLRLWFEKGISFNKFLDMKLEAVERGRAVARIPWRHELIGDPTRPAVHGGVLSTLADTAGGAACFAMLDSEEDRISTVDLRIDYLRPGPPADLVCEAVIVRMGRSVAVTRSHIYSGDLPEPGVEPTPLATAQAVYNVVRRS